MLSCYTNSTSKNNYVWYKIGIKLFWKEKKLQQFSYDKITCIYILNEIKYLLIINKFFYIINTCKLYNTKIISSKNKIKPIRCISANKHCVGNIYLSKTLLELLKKITIINTPSSKKTLF
jgi:hypothetical protein